jgi:hypothetical protein
MLLISRELCWSTCNLVCGMEIRELILGWTPGSDPFCLHILK